MTTTHELQPLLDRVRAATGPDRELDADIIKALGFHSWAGRMSFRDADGVRSWDFGNSDITGSVDAALALTERVLPGWVVADLSQNSRHEGDPWGCKLALYHGGDSSKNRFTASGSDFTKPQFAILAALLTALIARASA